MPRFGSGEAKGQILESVRGTDLYLLVDVLNYSMTYSLCGNENHMSPDDHYQDLKRIIALSVVRPVVSQSSCLSCTRAVSTRELPVSLWTVRWHCRSW